jgi:hypothetical protein
MIMINHINHSNHIKLTIIHNTIIPIITTPLMKRTTISKNLIKTITTRNTIIIITLLIRKQSFRNKYIAKKNM